MLAEGTGGFVIHNTNGLAAGMNKIAKEQDEYYLLGYSPAESPEGSCHALKVNVERPGVTVRARSGYCSVKPRDLLAGKPIERDLESRVTGSQRGDIATSIKALFFYIGANTTRVELVMEMASDAVHFEKEKGKFHAAVNVLGQCCPAIVFCTAANRRVFSSIDVVLAFFDMNWR